MKPLKLFWGLTFYSGSSIYFVLSDKYRTIVDPSFEFWKIFNFFAKKEIWLHQKYRYFIEQETLSSNILKFSRKEFEIRKYSSWIGFFTGGIIGYYGSCGFSTFSSIRTLRTIYGSLWGMLFFRFLIPVIYFYQAPIKYSIKEKKDATLEFNNFLINTEISLYFSNLLTESLIYKPKVKLRTNSENKSF